MFDQAILPSQSIDLAKSTFPALKPRKFQIDIAGLHWTLSVLAPILSMMNVLPLDTTDAVPGRIEGFSAEKTQAALETGA